MENPCQSSLHRGTGLSSNLRLLIRLEFIRDMARLASGDHHFVVDRDPDPSPSGLGGQIFLSPRKIQGNLIKCPELKDGNELLWPRPLIFINFKHHDLYRKST